MGAMIGAVGFLWASHDRKENGYPKGIGIKASLMILGGVSLVGVGVTYLFTRETSGRSLEENEKEDEYAGVCFLRCFPYKTSPCSTHRSKPTPKDADMSSRFDSVSNSSVQSTTPIN